jgi:uncharacterized protein YdaU (DUF1376 family)
MSKPSKKVDVWMPFYIGDYLRDTTHLTTEQHGAYFLLILNYWNRGKPLPDDDAHLSRVAGLTVDAWKVHRPTLVEFFDVRENSWFHGRIEEELTKAIKRAEDKSEAGKKGAAVRYGRANSSAIAELVTDASRSHSSAIAGASQKESQTHAPSQSSSSSSSSSSSHSNASPQEITKDTRGSGEPPCGLYEAISFGAEHGIKEEVVQAWVFVSAKNNWQTVKNGTSRSISNWKQALKAFAKSYQPPPTRDPRLLKAIFEYSDKEGFDDQRTAEWIEFNQRGGWVVKNPQTQCYEPIYSYQASLRGWMDKIETDKHLA